jgi:peptide-methionine (S)-S-oxide reductase
VSIIVKAESAILAGGCFWSMQDLLRRIPTVVSTRVGYTGDDMPNPTYDSHGAHAEAIEIVFDPGLLSYRHILEFFFQIHDPTTRNRQGSNIGTRYRSAIFYLSDAQRCTAEGTIADLEASGVFPGKVVTAIEPAGPFWAAEPEHQGYFERHPKQLACGHIRPGMRLPSAGVAGGRTR